MPTSTKKKAAVRINGFQRPFSDLQIVTWAIYPVFLAGFYVLVLPVLLSLDLVLGACIGGAYLLLHLWSARAAYVVTATDPADPLLQATPKYGHNGGAAQPVLAPRRPLHESCFHRPAPNSSEGGGDASGGGGGGNGGADEEEDDAECRPCPTRFANVVGCWVATCTAHPALKPVPAPAAEEEGSGGAPNTPTQRRTPIGQRRPKDTEFCYYCQITVESASKHCRFCDKCVHRFDHHCKWLNNCVGSNNYRDFLAVLGSTLLFTTLQLGASCYLAAAYFMHKDSGQKGGGDGGDGGVRGTVESLFGGSGSGSKVWLGFVLGLAGLLLVVVVLLAQLLHFHTVLLRNRQTTYEYVTQVQSYGRTKKAKKKKKAKNKTSGKNKEKAGKYKKKPPAGVGNNKNDENSTAAFSNSVEAEAAREEGGRGGDDDDDDQEDKGGGGDVELGAVSSLPREKVGLATSCVPGDEIDDRKTDSEDGEDDDDEVEDDDCSGSERKK